MAGKEEQEFFMDGDDDGTEAESQLEDLEESRTDDENSTRDDEEGDENASDEHGPGSFNSRQWPQSYR